MKFKPAIIRLENNQKINFIKHFFKAITDKMCNILILNFEATVSLTKIVNTHCNIENHLMEISNILRLPFIYSFLFWHYRFYNTIKLLKLYVKWLNI